MNAAADDSGSVSVVAQDCMKDPLWQASQLGQTIPPDNPHANSVCLPTWEANVAYEEGDPATLKALQGGYPRFVFNPWTRKWIEKLTRELAPEGFSALPLPSEQAAERCRDFLDLRGVSCRIHSEQVHGASVVLYPESAFEIVKKFWQHTGLIVSSRWAESALSVEQETSSSDLNDRTQQEGVIQRIRERLARVYEVDPDWVYIFPTGMAAIYETALALQRLCPGRPFAQIGFPYVDSWKVQSILAENSDLYPSLTKLPTKSLFKQIQEGRYCGVVMEMPSNPLLEIPDLLAFQAFAEESETPLIVDDTLASGANVDLLHHADAVTCSLTKYFSGSGDTMAGGLIVSPRRMSGAKLQGILSQVARNLIWKDDAIELERNSRDFEDRVRRAFASTAWLIEQIKDHPAIDKIHYPTTNQQAERLAFFHRPGGPKGFGALFSLELKNPEINAPKFFDRLQINKGPNLGALFTLCCPYTLLAHYNELDFAESCGVSRWLVRFSIGLEPREELLERILSALPSDG